VTLGILSNKKESSIIIMSAKVIATRKRADTTNTGNMTTNSKPKDSNNGNGNGDANYGDASNNSSNLIPIDKVRYRTVDPTDIFACLELEKDYYTPAEASSKNDLQYRQHHAAPYFRSAVFSENSDEDDDDAMLIGYICGTRCSVHPDEELQKLQKHHSHGPLLVLHSIVVQQDFRKRGYAAAMLKDYVREMKRLIAEEDMCGISKILSLAIDPVHLQFYVDCGFTSVRPSKKAPGKYDLEHNMHEERSLTSASNFPFVNNGGELRPGGFSCFVFHSFCSSKTGSGNPAAVVLLLETTEGDELPSSKWCQHVAAEFNLSETAFCWPRNPCQFSSKELHWNIRFFTPTMEISLCGHATLASAAVLFQTLKPRADSRIVFHAQEDNLITELAHVSDVLPAPPATITPLSRLPLSRDASFDNSYSAGGANTAVGSSNASTTTNAAASALSSKITMEFPSKPPRELTEEDRSAVCKMMQLAFPHIELVVLYIGISDIGDILIEVSPQSFQKIGYGNEDINFKAFLESCVDGYTRGVIVCCEYLAKIAAGGSFDSIVKSCNESRSSNIVMTQSQNLTSSLLSAHNERQGEGKTGGGENDEHSLSENSEYSDHDRILGDLPDQDPDFLSRFFTPKSGMDEDPVTGSAHCVLAPYFSSKLGGNKQKLIGKQMSQRGGIVECKLNKSGATVQLSGQAVMMMSGTLYL
jgi:predicted PhzF superfamily epimerase YddE/YHI9/GNAT superfamily N-acetyltransferase